jgi:hypothetical protein
MGRKMKLTLGPCEIAGVFGPMASGKTYLIDQWLKDQNRYVRFDVTGETCDDPSVEHFWQTPDASGPLRMYDAITTRPYYFKIAYHPGEDLQWEFRQTLRALWRRSEIFKMMVCDEFHEVCSVNDTPDFVKTMLRYARHAHLSMIGASQRIADVHKLFTAGCRQVIIFRSDEARDYIAVADRWGKDCAEAMRQLRPLIYDDVTKTTKQIPQCIVAARGKAPIMYDFVTDSFSEIGVASNVTEEIEEELPSEPCETEETAHDDTEVSL